MKSSKLFYYLTLEWSFRKTPRVLSWTRRKVQKLAREERQARLRELDEKIEGFVESTANNERPDEKELTDVEGEIDFRLTGQDDNNCPF